MPDAGAVVLIENDRAAGFPVCDGLATNDFAERALPRPHFESFLSMFLCALAEKKTFGNSDCIVSSLLVGIVVCQLLDYYVTNWTSQAVGNI